MDCDDDDGIPNLALAYIGGLFESSGRLSIENKTGKVTIYIYHQDRKPLEFTRMAVRAGMILMRESMNYWRLEGQKAIDIIKDIRPFVLGRRAELDQAIAQHFAKGSDPSG